MNIIKLHRAYSSIYVLLCGQHPYRYFWHDGWLATKDLYAHLRCYLPQLKGRVLDVGCGQKPYQSWLVNATDYVGIDLPGNHVADIHVQPTAPWRLPDASFDAVLCSQVIEHVQDLSLTLSEIHRVLRPGGKLILSAPFIYNLHGFQDYRRFSMQELCQLLSQDYHVITILPEGGAGSTLGILLLNWIELFFGQRTWTRLLKASFLHVWIIFAAVVNMLGYLWDKLDTTGQFYHNVLVVAEKR